MKTTDHKGHKAGENYVLARVGEHEVMLRRVGPFQAARLLADHYAAEAMLKSEASKPLPEGATDAEGWRRAAQMQEKSNAMLGILIHRMWADNTRELEAASRMHETLDELGIDIVEELLAEGWTEAEVMALASCCLQVATASAVRQPDLSKVQKHLDFGEAPAAS